MHQLGGFTVLYILGKKNYKRPIFAFTINIQDTAIYKYLQLEDCEF